MKKPLLFICIACALITAFCQYHHTQLLWVFKPLPLILMITWLGLRGVPGTYRSLILAGFVFSLIGDVFLIIPDRYFLHGLCSFFIAHICYIAAFYQSKKHFDRRSLSAFIYGIIMFVIIYPGIPNELKFPVLAYTLAISSMLFTALNFWFTQRNAKSRWALIGALFFVISDSMIAINKFYHPFFLARLCILLTYYTAQGFIASSVERVANSPLK